MKTAHILPTLVIVALASACGSKSPSKTKEQGTTASITQGVEGHVYFLKGNFMPSTTPGGNGGTTTAVVRKVRLYQPAIDPRELPEGSADGSLYKIKRKPLVETTSKPDGSFKLYAVPGTYTIMVVEPDGRQFCSSGDGNGTLCPITVVEKKWTTLDINVNYEAAY